MNDAEGEFPEIVAAVIRRFFSQNARPPPSDLEIARFSARLAAVVAERGLPPPLPEGEAGAPGGLPDAEVAALVARVIGPAADGLLAEAARQLVKACFYPEFRNCRDSFREVTRDGVCRRQQLGRVRGRISGAHCVDCPHWVALTPVAHREFLTREWRDDPGVWAAHRDVFLPEDFRALRRWLQAAARK